MNFGGWVFMISAFIIIIGLTAYCFYKVLTIEKKSKA